PFNVIVSEPAEPGGATLVIVTGTEKGMVVVSVAGGAVVLESPTLAMLMNVAPVSVETELMGVRVTVEPPKVVLAGVGAVT
ncbi:MAG: hypothetical protein JO329_22905, partial [Planctomycetaceae bacterium]|nr:hypothetical protein [Planctomycetaceae bacterium]